MSSWTPPLQGDTDPLGIPLSNASMKCRTCLRLLEYPLNHYTILNDLVKKMLTACVQLQVFVTEENEYYPLKICPNCYQELTMVYNFKCRVEWIEQQLKKVFDAQRKCIIEATLGKGQTRHLENSLIVKEEPGYDVSSTTSTEDVQSSQIWIKKEKELETLPEATEIDVSEDITTEPDQIWIKQETEHESNSETQSLHSEDVTGVHTEVLIKEDQEVENSSDGSQHNDRQTEEVDTIDEDHHEMSSDVHPHQCDLCDKSYPRLTQLHTHRRSHLAIYDLSCSQCGKKFCSQKKLSSHEKLHKRFFDCEFCDKKFMRPYELKLHQRSHTKERPFVCGVCGKATRTSGELSVHKRIHTNEKSFVCDKEDCGKAYRTSSALRVHQRIHSGQRPYECSVCTKGFLRKRTLSIHMATHSEERPFACELCSFRAKHDASLKAHMKYIHRDQDNESQT